MKSLSDLGIKHKKFEETMIASIRFNMKERNQLHDVLNKLSHNIPKENIIGPAFSITHFITSVKEGFDVETGFPVSSANQTEEIKTRILPEMEVLSLVHNGPVEKVKESLRKLYRSTSEKGLISDEFSREVYLDSNNPEGNKIELHMILHNWNKLLSENLERVLGEEIKNRLMKSKEEPSVTSSLDERFQWTKEVIERLDVLSNEYQKYDIVSSCAHIFGKKPIEKARVIYEKVKVQTNDPMKAVDAVLDFMDEDSAWPTRPTRDGNIIYSSKSPCNPKKYEEATNLSEKKKAYCFCPIIRNRLDNGMPITFCYCGAGWYRQQWEGIIDKFVRIKIIKSVLKGDGLCQFAIHLPDDL